MTVEMSNTETPETPETPETEVESVSMEWEELWPNLQTGIKETVNELLTTALTPFQTLLNSASDNQTDESNQPPALIVPEAQAESTPARKTRKRQIRFKKA